MPDNLIDALSHVRYARKDIERAEKVGEINEEQAERLYDMLAVLMTTMLVMAERKD